MEIMYHIHIHTSSVYYDGILLQYFFAFSILILGMGRVYFFQTGSRFRPCFSSVLAKKVFIWVSLGSKSFLFGPVSGPIFKGGFYFSEFNLIFFGSNYSGN